MSKNTEGLLGERAIVIGAGMGGMMAAGVLAKFFAEVMVLDKDKLPASPEMPNGVPQGTQAHVLLGGGARNAEQIFPGLNSDLIARGGVPRNWGLNWRTCDAVGWHPKRDLGIDFVGTTRPFLEHVVRANLGRLRNVTIRDGAKVTGWREGPDKITVTLAGGAEESLDADLAVDSSGRSGQALEMLEANGYGPVKEVVIGTGVSYSAAIYEPTAGWPDPLAGCAIFCDAPSSHVGFLMPVEGNLWLVALVGRFEQAPQKDPAGFMAFTKNLPDPFIHDRISKAKQLDRIRTFRPYLSKFRRYDRLSRSPERLLPLGDAVSQFNPMFGQGMSVASAHAMCLREVLAARAQNDGALNGAAKEYLQKACAVSEEVWLGLDPLEFSYATTTGERPAGIEEQIAFGLGLRKLIEADAEVHRLMMQVTHLLEPASVLMREDIVARVNAILAKG